MTLFRMVADLVIGKSNSNPLSSDHCGSNVESLDCGGVIPLETSTTGNPDGGPETTEFDARVQAKAGSLRLPGGRPKRGQKSGVLLFGDQLADE
jgi:hypothetical protein